MKSISKVIWSKRAITDFKSIVVKAFKSVQGQQGLWDFQLKNDIKSEKWGWIIVMFQKRYSYEQFGIYRDFEPIHDEKMLASYKKLLDVLSNN